MTETTTNQGHYGGIKGGGSDGRHFLAWPHPPPREEQPLAFPAINFFDVEKEGAVAVSDAIRDKPRVREHAAGARQDEDDASDDFIHV